MLKLSFVRIHSAYISYINSDVDETIFLWRYNIRKYVSFDIIVISGSQFFINSILRIINFNVSKLRNIFLNKKEPLNHQVLTVKVSS